MKPDENDFGEKVKFEVGDKVKVWRVFKNPVGTVEAVRIDPEKKPIFYLISYIYPDTGDKYLEEYESDELTLVERRSSTFSVKCECGGEATGGGHSIWCKKRSY